MAGSPRSPALAPTEDGRIKPDITAPGFALASSVNSYDTSYNTTGTIILPSSALTTDAASGRIYKYAMLAGTSMASPCVAGIVAMMLQVNPSLSPDDAKNIINNYRNKGYLYRRIACLRHYYMGAWKNKCLRRYKLPCAAGKREQHEHGPDGLHPVS